jgi:hypothetical protein
VLISGYCYQKGCYYPKSYTLRAHRTDPCSVNELLSTGFAIIRVAINRVKLYNEMDKINCYLLVDNKKDLNEAYMLYILY